jgi:1-pyrroline-5-carboxylate dehydrogenase
VLGVFAKASAEHADRAVEAASAAFQTWRFVPPEDRARYLLRAAALLRRRKHEFSATMVLEVGKSWPRPTLTPPSRLISWNTTRARCCACR